MGDIRHLNTLNERVRQPRGLRGAPKTGAEKSRDWRTRNKQKVAELERQVALYECKATAVAPLNTEMLSPNLNVATPQNGAETGDATSRNRLRNRLRAWCQPLVIICRLLFLGCATIGYYQSGRYLWSLATGSDVATDGVIMVMTAAIAETVALFGLAVIATLWRQARDGFDYLLVTALVPVYLGAIVYAALNSVGFNTSKIDDSLAGRESAKELRTAIIVEIGEKKQARAKIDGTFTPTSDTRVSSHKAGMMLQCPANKIGERCRLLGKEQDELEKARDLTQEMARLNVEIRDLERRLDGTPNIKSADALVDGLQRLIGHVSDDVVGWLRVGLGFITLLGGLFWMCAQSLVEGRLEGRR